MKLVEVWLRDSLPTTLAGGTTSRCIRATMGTELSFEGGFITVTPKDKPAFLVPLAFVACMTPAPVEAKKKPGVVDAKPSA